MTVNLFDVNFYRDANNDLAGLTPAEATSHFQTLGLNEGRAFSPFVNLNFYRAANSDLGGFNNQQLFEHLQSNGVAEGRRLSPFVDLNFYRANNNDLRGLNNEQLFEHLRSNGIGEGRSFSPFADLGFYRANNSDLEFLSEQQLFKHLQIVGLRQQREFSPFVDLGFYRASNSDLERLDEQALLQHLEIWGINEGRQFSLATDLNFYRASNPDLASSSNSAAFEHLQILGIEEERRFSRFVDLSFYRSVEDGLEGTNRQQVLDAFVSNANRYQGRNHSFVNARRLEDFLNAFIAEEIQQAADQGKFKQPSAIVGSIIAGQTSAMGELSSNDLHNSLRLGSFSDDYYLTGIVPGEQIQINLASTAFDTYLQLLDGSTGRIIAFNDDFAGNRNSRLEFIVQEGINYVVRATSFGTGATGDYTLTSQLTPDPFDNRFGYGLVNAAAAVASAINAKPFPNVSDLGGNAFGADLVRAPEVWAQGFTGQNVLVAVVDSGVDYNHIDLSANIWTNDDVAGNGIDDDNNGFIDDTRGWDFLDNDNTPLDLYFHGTHVAGTIAAINNGASTPTGIAYNATIMPVRVLSNYGSIGNSIAQGIRYAASNGARVINLSLSGGFSGDVEAAVNFAVGLGAVVVMASGNDNDSEPGFPARQATTAGLAVGALDRDYREAYFSNRAGNTTLDYVMAPGVDIFSTFPNNNFAIARGTSTAAPHVAGVVALMLSANPNLTPAQVESILTATASNAGLRASIRN